MKPTPVMISVILLTIMASGCTQQPGSITSFGECAAAGYPVMESYPR